ncbi:MAG TPA: CoA transferase [Stellaceae bacterium]|jgi:crotonobetainyl-CoA:carnitine CoA-transferase CaiB-like acyl-CoA transferase|nr:CoA transferase [Stellaceae bacterium]
MTKQDSGPLAGLKVLDLTEHMAGPFCTMILADMGAEVVKLERPGKGDSVRAWGDGSERNPYFRYINRNKKGITLDYKTPEGKALFLRLVESIDILVENYRPNVMPRAGLGFEDLHALNPRLVYAQLSGLGYDGPSAGRGGFDLIAQGMGGIMHVTGETDGPPTSVGLPICDLGTGMWAVQGILAALYERERTGTGRLVECSLLETAIGFSSWTSAQWLADHEEPTRQGSRHRQNAPYQRMKTKDGYLMIGAAGEAIWQRCAAALGHPEWRRDPRFATNQQRMQNRAALEAAMEDVFATGTTDHWIAVLEAAGVPCGPVYNYRQMFADPQVEHRRLVQYASDPELGKVAHIRTPIKIGEAIRVRTVAPKLGQHNAEIFGRLGVGEADLAALREQGVV